jgi:predicted nuclease with TOPRIM domain
MNKIEKELQEKKELLKEWTRLCIEHPNSSEYQLTLWNLHVEIADLAEKLYKNK